MKNKTYVILIILINAICSVISFYLWRNNDFKCYGELVTFLSIMIGFKLTFMSVLFNSSLRKILYEKDDNEYFTALHRLANQVRFALFYEFFAVVSLMFLQNYRFVLILPIIVTCCVFFVALVNIFLLCLTYPRND